ncbi:MAG: nucleotidyltransferase family protein [Bacilli bacterium]|nr:nucleotidyltransferase family protein [Bacilli bacterium]
MKNNIDSSFLNLIYILYYSINLEEKIDSNVIKEFDFKSIYKIAKSHSVLACVYPAIKDSKIDANIIKTFEQAYNSNLRKTMLFDVEFSSIKDEMVKREIYYTPLKGINIKTMYPLVGTREFADFDILFDPKKAKEVKEIFINRGYKVEGYGTSHHDAYHKEPFFNFEMHRFLFDPIGNTQLFEKYYKNIETKLIEVAPYSYKLKDEDDFIYFLCHAYKHYSRGGNGIRFLLDLYIYITHKKLDFNYILTELRILKICGWYLDIETLVRKLFSIPFNQTQVALTENEENILSYILNSGTYGTLKNGVYSVLNSLNGGEEGKVRKWSKFRYMVSRICLPRKQIIMTHPFIGKTIIFIPFIWIGRIFKALFNKKSHQNMKNEMKYIKQFGK